MIPDDMPAWWHTEMETPPPTPPHHARPTRARFYRGLLALTLFLGGLWLAKNGGALW